MPRADAAERRLYRDLSGLLAELRAGPFADLERAIEERFRRYLGDARRSPGDTLSVTFSWQLPEGADSWALYGTEFQIEMRGNPAGEQPEAAAGNAADNVIPFPAPPRERARRGAC